MYDFPGIEEQVAKDQIYGEKETLSIVRDNVQIEIPVRDIGQYMADALYYYRIKESPYRTMNPDEADLFYVPLLHYHVGWDQSNLRLSETGVAIEKKLTKMLHHLNNNTANRHIQIAGHTGDVGCAYWYSHLPLVAQMYRLSLEHYKNRGLKNYRSIIYPTVASGLNKNELKMLMTVAASGQRPYLIMSLFGLHGSDPAMILRKDLHNQCAMGDHCHQNPFPLLNIATAMGRHEIYSKSVFCLQPPGDSPSRKAMLDVMVAGCVPVLFWKNQTELWPYHVKSWDKVSILIEPENHYKTIDVLTSISGERIRMLRRNIIELIPLLSYKPFGSSEDYNDAFEATLVGLWKEIRETS